MKQTKKLRAKGDAVSRNQLDLFLPRVTSRESEKSSPPPPQKRASHHIKSAKNRTGVSVSPRPNAPNQTFELVDGLLDTQAAARRLGIGVSTLEKMRVQRRGPPFVKLAKNVVRYRAQDLDEWIVQQIEL